MKKTKRPTCSWVRTLIYRFNPFPIETPANFFVETDKLILKLMKNVMGPEIATVLEKNKVAELTFADCKTD